ncbi:hypothetical protein QVD17_30164 [Tagetes erecta]|uniref:Disease resistance protein At4g27190-like leucine-rich repeats domain-containing protein n=1 Tax=Tagetes erecta TaxID=13708 RepID=A0AAD8NFS8_TARER|nr:hypothetical protein QVD17_30164 [Tagetes erecta]
MELPQLKELNLYNLPKIVSIFPEIVTPKLEIMIVYTMMSLKEIWSCEITSSKEEVYNTIMLKQLCIGECLSLIVLFPIPVAKRLKKLEILEVSWCLVLKSVVSDENREVGSRKFESLKSLSLYEVPELVSLCDHVNAMELPQLVKLDLFQLPNIVTIFPKVITPKERMNYLRIGKSKRLILCQVKIY